MKQSEASTESKKRFSYKEARESLAIFRFIVPYKRDFIIGLLLLVLSSVTILVFPYVTGKLIDVATGKATGWLNNMNIIAVLLFAVLTLQAIFSYGRVWFFARVSEYAMADVRTSLYSKIITLPIPFFEQRRVGELVSRITTDVTQLQDTISLTLAEFLREIATLLVGIVIIFVTSPKLASLMLITYPFIVVSAIFFGRYIKKLSKKTQDALADANVIVEETFQSVHIVKAFTNEAFESNRFGKAIQSVVDIALHAAKYRGAFISFIIFGIFGGIVLVLWYGAYLVQQGEITIGELTAFILYTMFIGGAVGGMGDVYSKLQKTIGASERLIELLDEQSEIDLKETNSTDTIKEKLNGNVEFSGVTFSYPARKDVQVLKNIDFKISRGEKIALVGSSGAGKSTIIQLLAGFYRPDSGTIKIDDQSFHDYSLKKLRSHIGIVPQEIMLFGGSIRENIAYGKPGAGETEIMDAAKKANAWEFIQSFPEKMETLVGERGVKLSGGQKQRIAIARAILKDPEILILDEATSSLDSASELLVQQALEELMKNRTTIIIAHRLSTIRKVNKILVIKNGRIIESGTHDELEKNKEGFYYHLLNLQFNMEEEVSVRS